MRKLIDIHQQNFIVCDNPECDFEIPHTGQSEKLLLAYINVPCPKCGQSLLTPEDYLMSERLMKAVHRINKWFSWLTLFMPKKDIYKSVCVHVHDGIQVTPAQTVTAGTAEKSEGEKIKSSSGNGEEHVL